MKVLKRTRDTIMTPMSDKDRKFCDQLMQGSNTAVVKLKTDQTGMYLEFTPVRDEDIED